jgi:hypothetical protein
MSLSLYLYVSVSLCLCLSMSLSLSLSDPLRCLWCLSSKLQKHDMVHVEIFLGGETGTETIGSRYQKGFIQIFPSYQFDSKLWTLKQYHFCSLEPWLDGLCQSSCPEHAWINPKAIGTGGKSIFDDDDEEEEAAGEDENEEEEPNDGSLLTREEEDQADMIGGGDGDDDEDCPPPAALNQPKPFLKKASSRGPATGRLSASFSIHSPLSLSVSLSLLLTSLYRGQRKESCRPNSTNQLFSIQTKSSQSQPKYGLGSQCKRDRHRERPESGFQTSESSAPSSDLLCW